MSGPSTFANMEPPGPSSYSMAKYNLMSNSVSGNYVQKGMYEGKAEPVINPMSLMKKILDPLYSTMQMYAKK